MTVIELARIESGRAAAAELFPSNALDGTTILVDARGNFIADYGFVYELVRLAIDEYEADELLVLGCSGEFRRGEAIGQLRADLLDVAEGRATTALRFLDLYTRLVVPRLAGSRSSAAMLATCLGDVEGEVVIVDARGCLSMAQGYADELVKQVLGERGAELLLVQGAGGRLRKIMERSAELRDLPAPRFSPWPELPRTDGA